MKSNLPQRRLIPKWRPVATTLQAAEATPVGLPESKVLIGDPDELHKAISLWRETKASGVLGDVLSFSVHPELQDLVLDVGKEAVRIGAPLTSVQSMLIRDLDKGSDAAVALPAVLLDQPGSIHPFQEPIQRLRALLRTAPDNALALLDYAQLQSAIGKLTAAEQSLRVALSLAPNNRTVIRTVARFYVHANKSDLAHQLIRRHQRTSGDPWLMASEIALADAAGVESTFLSKGKRFLLEQTRYPNAHLTELAGVIASQELFSGNLKKAREAQRKALLAPNDNMIAQAVELQHNFGIALEGPQISAALSRSSEALVLQSWANMRPEGVERHAQVWHTEEPFSSRPIQMLSTLYAFRGEHHLAIRWIEAGLLADANDRGLLINLAFVQACVGQSEKSAASLRKLRHLYGKNIEPYAKATEGLIEYTHGRFESGDRLYDEAVGLFELANQRQIAAYCRVNQALAVIDCEHPLASEIIEKATTSLRESPSFDSSMLLRIRTAPTLDTVEVAQQDRRLLGQWVFDAASNTLTHKPGVTAVGAKAIVLLNRPS